MTVVAQRVLRLLVIVAAVGVLLMHGADASAAATHEAAPAVAHEHHDDRSDTEGHALHWHDVALACIAVLTAAVALVRRSRQATIDGRARTVSGLAATWRQPVPNLLGTGPPTWIELAVIRR